MDAGARAFLDKARQSMAGAEREYAADAFDNVANRCYYAAFQAAISILLEIRAVSPAKIGGMKHPYVRSEFASVVVRRKKLLTGVERKDMDELATARDIADYLVTSTGKERAKRLLDVARRIVQAVGTFLEGER